jgi:hypothetical protein
MNQSLHDSLGLDLCCQCDGNPTRETMVTNVISQLLSATTELSTIVKICKYKVFNEGHHFVSMATNMHDALQHDMNHFIIKCVHFFHDRQS